MIKVSFCKLRVSQPARWLGLATLVAWCAVAPTAAAQGADGEAAPQDEKQVCSVAFEQAQRLLNETKYLAANQEILKCANPKCGDALSQECSRMYNEVQAAQPTVVFSARDATKGTDLFEVSLGIDGGEATTTKLDGRAMPLDPGNHTFTFSTPGFAAVEQQVVIRSGEKFRQISVVFGAQPTSPMTAPQPGATPAPESVAEPELGPRKMPVASYVLGGVGIVGIGVGIAFRAVGASQYDQLQRDCKPNCPQSDIDKVKAKYTLSYVGLGVGAAALVGAVTIYLAQPREAAPVTAFTLAPTRDGMSAALLGRF